MPYTLDYTLYDVGHVLAQLQLLAFSALAFTWLKLSGIYPPERRSVNLDSDWLYRRGLPLLASLARTLAAPWNRRLREASVASAARALRMLFRHHGRQGGMARSRPTGWMVLWVGLLLKLSLLLYFF